MTPKIAESPRKRKPLRGLIRARSWTGADGVKKSAWQADFGTVNGKRMMRSFGTKADAENWLHEQRVMLEDQGHAAYTLTNAQRMDAVKALDLLTRDVEGLPKTAPLEHIASVYATCWSMLKDTGRTITDAAGFMVKHATKAGERRTVTVAVAEYVQDAKDNNLRQRSVAGIEYGLAKLVARFGTRPISEVTRTDADAWLRGISLSPISRKNHRVIAHGLFNFAIDRGYYAADNPFTVPRHRRKYQADEKMPECLPWRAVEKIMEAALEHEPSMIPALAIGFFAGVRSGEVIGLDWADVDLDARRITVMPAVAKKRRARHGQIEDNLFQWLAPYRKVKGLIAPQGEKWRSRLDTIRDKAKVGWPHNAMRHSFASHHLAKYGDAAKTAMQLGHHRDTSMLFEHYRALVTPEDGASYFNIRPALPASGTIQFKATA